MTACITNSGNQVDFFLSTCFRGLHNPELSLRSRVFYLFHRFIKEDRNDIPPELAVSLLEGMRDLLVINVEIPELENPEQQDILTEAVSNPGIFDSQLYLFETAGTLVSLLFKIPDQASVLLLSVVNPLLEQLSASLQSVKSREDVLPILKVHHIIMALGNVAKGFPDYPSPVPEGYALPALDVFNEVAQAILVSLEAINVFKVVRDAVCSLTDAVRRVQPHGLLDKICLCSNSSHHWT